MDPTVFLLAWKTLLFDDIFSLSENKEVRKGILNLSDMKMYREIISDSWIYQLATLINFTTTLAIFPAATVLIEPAVKTGKKIFLKSESQEGNFFVSSGPF